MTPAAIRTLRRALEMTRDEFAEALGYTGKNRRITVWRLETGKTKPGGPTSLVLSQLEKKARLLP